LKEDDAQRLKALAWENSRLKRIIAEQALEISTPNDPSKSHNGEPAATSLRGQGPAAR